MVMTFATGQSRERDAELVAVATQLIRERMWRGVSGLAAGEIAAECEVSVRRLQRAFYRESPPAQPLTFQQAVVTQRMQAARELLRSRRRISAAEAARRVGYRDVAQFTRSYRLRFGVTPAADRLNAGGRARGGQASGAARSQRSRREHRRRRAVEARFLEADVASTAAIFELNHAEKERAAEIAVESGLAAMHRWVRAVHAAKLDVEHAEWQAQMVMLDTSVILRRAELLRQEMGWGTYDDEVEQ